MTDPSIAAEICREEQFVVYPRAKIVAYAYTVVAVLAALYALSLQSFPGNLQLPLALLGPLVFLLPIKWISHSVVYFIVSSTVLALLYWVSERTRNRLLARLLICAALALWLVVGIGGLVYLAFAVA